jgi:hypothetical protein
MGAGRGSGVGMKGGGGKIRDEIVVEMAFLAGILVARTRLSVMQHWSM